MQTYAHKLKVYLCDSGDTNETRIHQIGGFDTHTDPQAMFPFLLKRQMIFQI